MAKFILSAFADEYSPSFDQQMTGLLANGVPFMEIRGVDGKNISEIPSGVAKELQKKLMANGLGVSSVGSPIGKIKLDGDFDAHLESFKHIVELAHIFECGRIRLFSFYIPQGKKPDDCRGEVLYKMGKLLDVAKSEAVNICHENESGIYGDTALRCLDIQQYFSGEIKCIFDHANFICCGEEPYPYAFNLLKDYIYYFHIKDALLDKTMAPAGEGIGKIPETLAELKEVDKTYVLTVEPHLRVFSGLDKLQHSTDNVKNQYANSAEAFSAAVSAIKRYI